MTRLNQLLVLGVFSLGGCTNQALYENIQADQKLRCTKLPAAQYEECMERANMPYEEYEREREKVLQNGE